ncbi:MAG: STAS domain-containing protein [Tepidisphaeraceae bacterium]|jgi:anti-sigma B factor antagonist
MSETQGNLDLVSSPQTRGEAILAAVRGEVDLHNSPELRAALLGILGKSLPKKLVLNLAAVPYMDSSAVAVLVEVLQRLRRSGGRLMLSSLQPRVRGLLEIARLDSIFVLAITDDEALEK